VSSRIERLKIGPIGENTYAIESQGVGVLVDPGADAASILEFLAEKAFDISIIALTHGHLDHCAAIPELMAAWQDRHVEIAIHPEDKQYLGEKGEATNHALFEAIHAVGFFKSFWRAIPEATMFLNDGEYIRGTSLLVMHTPGHSRGSVCFYESDMLRSQGEEKLPFLVSGDTLFRDGVGRIDTPDADPIGLRKSLERLALLPPETIVFPGHGPRTMIGREFHGIAR
jgi:glyoxylase-like metal-dependent hydrolase (beta-lactamase superfamily II)